MLKLNFKICKDTQIEKFPWENFTMLFGYLFYIYIYEKENDE